MPGVNASKDYLCTSICYATHTSNSICLAKQTSSYYTLYIVREHAQ